jgi:hypothetical protein
MHMANGCSKPIQISTRAYDTGLLWRCYSLQVQLWPHHLLRSLSLSLSRSLSLSLSLSGRSSPSSGSRLLRLAGSSGRSRLRGAAKHGASQQRASIMETTALVKTVHEYCRLAAQHAPHCKPMSIQLPYDLPLYLGDGSLSLLLLSLSLSRSRSLSAVRGGVRSRLHTRGHRAKEMV